MLQKGDIIHIEKGLSLMCEEIPEIYFKGMHPYSKRLGKGMVTIGELKPAYVDIKPYRDEITTFKKDKSRCRYRTTS